MVLRSQLPQRLQTDAGGLDVDGDPRQPGDDHVDTRTGVPMSMNLRSPTVSCPVVPGNAPACGGGYYVKLRRSTWRRSTCSLKAPRSGFDDTVLHLPLRRRHTIVTLLF